MNFTFKQKLNAYLGMSKRNIKVFFRDRSTVFFSILSPLIVLVLYILFLKQTYVDVINNQVEGLQGLVTNKDIDTFINLWLLSGILGTSCITVALNSLTIIVVDKHQKIDYDYNASPISGPIVALSYFTGAFINTLIIGTCILTVGLVYTSVIATSYISFSSLIMIYITLIIGCASSNLIMMIVVSFFNSPSGLGAFSGIVSAAVGFIIGAYMPVSQFDLSIQTIANIIPGSHITSLFRNYLMSGVLDHINESIIGLDGGAFSSTMKELFSFDLNVFSMKLGINQMIIYSLSSIVIFLGLNILFYKKS